MISQIGLRNVRLFGDLGYTFNLPALTIFCGTNSSGKSTILKSLLLLRQSQGLYEMYGTRPGILRLTGSQVDLGNYQSFVADRRSSRSVEISIAIQDRIPSRLAMALAQPKNLNLGFSERQQLIDYVLETTFSFKAFRGATATDEAGSISTVSPKGILHRADFRLLVNGHSIASWFVRRSASGKDGSLYKLNLPVSDILEWDRGFKELVRNVSSGVDRLSVTTELNGLLPSYLVSKDKGVTTTRQEELRLPFHIRGTLGDFTTALLRIHYLAPLRTAAKRYYLANYDVTADLDPSGDFLPYILGGIIEEPKVFNVPPKRKTGVTHSLSKALDVWLYYLRTGRTFNLKSSRSEFGVSTSKGTLVEIELKALKGALKHSIADSGFGYSQVLPILVRGLIAPKNSTLVVEQPELHLNPALQVRLVDFFISLIRAGKQIIIETHSEHIVNAVRIRTAKEKDGFLSNESKIYFLDIKGGRPVIHDMSIKPDGTVPGWPFHFFGEAAALTGELLRAQKARKER